MARALVVAAGLLAAAMLGPRAQAAPDTDPNPLEHEAFTLKNGLRVLLLPDRRVPRVEIVTWFRVGSADEDKGKSGFAHLFEHLMFEGSPNAREGLIDRLATSAGGTSNAYTTTDETVYTMNGSIAFLEQALWLEADRIAGLPAAMNQKVLDNQRDIVLNERRQNYENRPYGMAWLLITEALWPPDHPYHLSTMGSPEDLRRAALADVKAFFAAWYSPRNATIVIAGDFDPAAVKPLVDRYLGWIPAPAPPRRKDVKPPPPIAKEIVVKTTDDVNTTRVYLTWRGPTIKHADEPTLELAAAVLAGGKSSRLYRKLVVDKRLAQDVHAASGASRLGGVSQIVVTCKPGVDANEVIELIDQELAALAREPPTSAELARAKNGRESRFWSFLEPMSGRAQLLASYDVQYGDARYLTKDLARFRAVSTADVQAAVKRWLAPAGRVVLIISPGGKPRAP